MLGHPCNDASEIYIEGYSANIRVWRAGEIGEKSILKTSENMEEREPNLQLRKMKVSVRGFKTPRSRQGGRLVNIAEDNKLGEKTQIISSREIEDSLSDERENCVIVANRAMGEKVEKSGTKSQHFKSDHECQRGKSELDANSVRISNPNPDICSAGRYEASINWK